MTRNRPVAMASLNGLVVFCVLVAAVTSYPNGAPQSTCGDLTPHHGDLQPQATLSPYTLTPALQRVVEGNKLRLVLNAPDGEDIAGFMIQARDTNGSEVPLGTFTADPKSSKTLTCGSGIKNTLTHKDNNRKKSLEVEWEAPADYEGPVHFTSTFVKDGATFWVGVETEPVQVVRRSASDQGPPGKGISTTKIPIRATTVPNYTLKEVNQTTLLPPSPIYTGCEDQKLCFGVPSGCTDSGDCNMMVAVTVSPSLPDKYTFELLGGSEYIAVGLSDNDKMGDDNVVACSNDGKYSMSTNIAKKNNMLPDAIGVELISNENKDGKIYCKFTRDAKTTVSETIWDLANNNYYLLLAQGPLGDDGVKLAYHSDTGATGSSLSLGTVGTAGAKSNLLYRLHGAFMLAAWIGFAGTGMLVARYFKKTWVGTQSCGKDIWFAWHRAFMVITWLLTNVAFIIIFVEIGGWYGETSNPHGVLGVITTALCFIQPIAANFRPGPKSPKRPFFNWAHWLLGNLSHLLGVITIFFARTLGKSELPDWVDWIVAAYVAFHCIMHIIFAIVDSCTKKESQKINNMPMKEMGTNARMNNFADTKRDDPLTGTRKFLLALYLIIVCGMTIALVVVSALAPIEKNETVKKVVSFLMPNNETS